jgi:hypothetical protein
MDKIFKDGSNSILENSGDAVLIDMAKDEQESFQLVVIPVESDLKRVKVSAQFISDASNLRLDLYKVGYVKTGNPGYPVEHIGLWPDILWPIDDFDVACDEVQPIWVKVTAEPQANAGLYKAVVKVETEDEVQKFPLTIRVRNFVIPRPGKLAMPFGLYRNFIEQWYYGENGSLNHDKFLEWCEFLAEYRITAKNIGYEYVEKKYEDKDGQNILVSVDYSKTAKGVEFLSNKYFADYSYGLYRMPSGPTVRKALDNPEKYQWCTPQRIASDAITYFEQYKKLNFNDKAYIYGIDEAIGEDAFDFAAKTYAIIKEHIPDAKIMQTGNCNNPKLIGLVDIWCPKLGLSDEPFFQERLKEGDILWQYVCGSPLRPFLNLLVDQSGLEHRMIFWHTRKIGASGFLYWTVVSGCRDWKPKPWQSENAFPNSIADMTDMVGFTDLWIHTNGDGQIVYPGTNLTPIPSIRLEIIRDGIEDYEYFNILDRLIEEVKKIDYYNTAGTKNLMERAQQLAQVPDEICKSGSEFNHDYYSLLKQRKEIADMIEQFNHILDVKDYKKWKR